MRDLNRIGGPLFDGAPDDVLALDIGGANIKAANGDGWVHSKPFALWKRRSKLVAALERIVAERRPRRVVATMTGEIADCYDGRRDGVTDIVDAVCTAAEEFCPVGFYTVEGRLVTPAEAIARPLAVAASNWHAVARLAATLVTADRAVLIDVGSTTTDIVPICDGWVTPLACDDVGRMLSGELVYTGVERTPVAAIVRSLPWRGRLHPLASELFAESRDVWLMLNGLDPLATGGPTADGRPATREAAARRLARMLLADPADVTESEAVAMAEWCADRQSRQVALAMARVAAATGGPPRCVVVSGHGACLARRSLARVGWSADVVSLADRLGAAVSRAAPAHGLALLARGLIA